jgi:hypothetical protein
VDAVADEAIVCEVLGIGWLELMATPHDHIEARMLLKREIAQQQSRSGQSFAL